MNAVILTVIEIAVLLLSGFLIFLWIYFSRKIPILMYHLVDYQPGVSIAVPPEIFDRQMRYLQNCGFNSISLLALRDHILNGTPLPAKPIVLTFDDGYVDNLTQAAPILKKYEMTGTVFLISDWIDRPNDFETNPKRPKSRLMNADQIRSWMEAGNEVGAHSVSHPHLTFLSDDDLGKELTQSKLALESMLGAPIDTFCYPYGAVDKRVRDLTESAGYKCAVTVSSDARILGDDLYALPRVMIRPHKSLLDFKIKTSPLHIIDIWLNRQKENRREAAQKRKEGR